MHSSKSTVEMGFCSLHRRKRTKVDLVPIEDQPGQMRCKSNKECRQRMEVEMVVCSLHNRRRNIHQMKEVRKGIFQCLPQFVCRGQFGDPVVAPTTNSAPPLPSSLPARGSRPQQPIGVAPMAPPPTVAWAPTSGYAEHAAPTTFAGWSETQPKTWCAKHGKLTNQCEFVKESYYVCYDASACLSTPLDLPTELLEKGCSSLVCSIHNTLRIADFLERAPDKMSYQCVDGHHCRGTLIGGSHEMAPDRGTSLTRDTVSSFFV